MKHCDKVIRILCSFLCAVAWFLCAPAGAADLPVQDGLITWLKADAINTSDTAQVRDAAGTLYVKQWNDQSGFNRHASNGTENDQPQYIGGALNGLPVLRFGQDSDDTGDRLYLGDLGTYAFNAGTLFVVASIDNDGRYNLFGNRNNDERWVADTWSEAHPGSFRANRAGGSFYQAGFPTTGSHVFALESSRSVYRFLVNGSEIGSDSADYDSGSGQNWTIGNRSTAGQQLRGDIAEVIIYNHILTADEANRVGKYLADKYGLGTAYVDAPVVPQATIYDLRIPGYVGLISGNNVEITVPFGTDVTALAPTYMLSAGANCDKASGSVQNFQTPKSYTVVSSDLATTNVYTVSVRVRAPSVSYDFTGGLQGWIQFWPQANATPPGALWQNNALGSGHDQDDPWSRFGRSPEFVLHAQEDLTFQLQGGQSPLAAPAAPSAIPERAINGGGFAGVALRDVATDTYVLWARRDGNGDSWQTVRFTTNDLTPYIGKRLTLDYMDYNMGGWGWTYLDNVSIPGYGTRVTLQATDPAISMGYNANTTIVTVKIPEGINLSSAVTAYITNSSPAVVSLNGSSDPVVSITFAAGAPFSQNITVLGKTLGTATLTAGVANLDSAVLTITVCPPAIGRWFSGPASLAETSGYRPAGAHDGVAVGTAASLAFTAEVPPGCTGQSLDLRAGNVAVMVANSATNDASYLNTFDDVIRSKFTVAFWAKGFPGQWNPWLSKRGENGIGWQFRRIDNSSFSGFTMRGIDNDDDWGSSVNVNDNKWHHFAAVWDQATGTRKVYIDGVFSHTQNNAIGQMMTLAPGKHLVLGGREQGGAGYESYFSGLLYDVRLYSYPLSLTEVRGLIPPAVRLASRQAVRVGSSAPLTVTIPVGLNTGAPVTVYLTNSQPALMDIGGNTATTVPVFFAAGAATSQTVTLNGLLAGQVVVSAGGPGLVSASTTIEVYNSGAPGLLGRWFTGPAHLADVSGYTDGTHDGSFVGIPGVAFTNDVPPGRSGSSLNLRSPGNLAVRINNTRIPDASYMPTFDDNLAAQFTVSFWAKGFPASDWAGWVTKEGEDGRGWQLRRWGGNPTACFTIRGLSNEDGTGSTVNVNDNTWHHYVGVWNQATATRALYVDGILSHVVTNLEGQVMNLAPNAPMVFGAKANQDNNYDGNRWVKCQLFDVRLYNLALSSGEVLDLTGVVLTSPSSFSLSAPSPNTNLVTILVPPALVAAGNVTVTVTSDKPNIAAPVGATGGVLAITFTQGGPNSATFAVEAKSAGTARFTYACPLVPAPGVTTVAVQQQNIGARVAYWSFDNQTLEETSGFQPAGIHDGTAVGNVAFVPGRLGGYAADLRAANTAIRVKNTVVTDADYRTTFDAFLFGSPQGFSLSCWVKGMPVNDWSSWIAKDGEAAGYAVRRAWGSRVTFTLRNSGDPGTADDDPTDPNAVITDNLWHHLAAVYDPVAMQRRLYVDGVERISVTDSNVNTPATSVPLCFGARNISADPRFARVIVDEISAYDRVLTPLEITNQVGAPMISLTPGQVNRNLGEPDVLATVTVPQAMLNAGPVTVTLTSANPAIATIVGGTAGSLTLNFAQGGANTATAQLHGVAVGSTVITATSPSGIVNGEVAVSYTTMPIMVGHWITGSPDLADKSGYKPAGTHDGTPVGNNAASLTYSSDLPANFTGMGQSLDLTVGTVGVAINNSSWVDAGYQSTFDAEIATNFTIAFWAKGMPGEWAGWVAKGGEGGKGWVIRRMWTDSIAGFTMRGIDNEDGWGSGINVNNGDWHHYVGIWDQATGTRRLYVDGNYSHTVYNNTSQFFAQAQGAHLVLGGMQEDNGSYRGDRWTSCLLFDVRVYKFGLSDNAIQNLIAVPTVQVTLKAQIAPGNQLRISWPTSASGYSIEQSSSPSGGWVASGLSVGVEGDEYVAYAPTSGAPQFFRLKK